MPIWYFVPEMVCELPKAIMGFWNTCIHLVQCNKHLQLPEATDVTKNYPTYGLTFRWRPHLNELPGLKKNEIDLNNVITGVRIKG